MGTLALVDRRGFLKAGAIGGGVVVAGGAAIALQSGELRFPPREPLHVLDATRFNVVAAIAARTAGTPDIDPIAVAHAADAALRYAPPEARDELGIVLAALENGLSGLLLRGSAQPFSALDGPGQDRALDRWLESRIELVRGAGQALRKLTLASYYAPLAVARTTGYPGPLFEKPDPGPIEARARLSEPYVPKTRTATGAAEAAAAPAAVPTGEGGTP